MPRHHTAKRPKSLASNESRTRIDERLSEIRSGMCARCGGSYRDRAEMVGELSRQSRIGTDSRVFRTTTSHFKLCCSQASMVTTTVRTDPVRTGKNSVETQPRLARGLTAMGERVSIT